jgi:hypothetical protein
MFHLLSGTNQARIQNRRFGVLFHQFGPLLDKTFHRFALLPAGRLLK